MNKEEMIESVANYLSFFGEVDYAIINAIKEIDRGDFYFNLEVAYNDISQPIDFNQSLIRPSLVARMLNNLSVKSRDFVLEVGAGTGWTASLLSYLARDGRVLSLEIFDELIEESKKNIEKYYFLKNLVVDKKDFLSLNFKFDKILFSCGIDKEDELIIESWISSHLKDGGRAVVPYENGPLIIFFKEKNNLKKEYTEDEYCFDPIIGNFFN